MSAGPAADKRYSLVVLTSNRPGPLARCLRSIERLEWTGPRPEIVVVDDGSVPPSREVVAGFVKLKPVYLYQSNRGVAAARNTGLKASSGSHVAFIADDYVLPPDYLKNVDAFFRERPDDLVITHNLASRGEGLFMFVQRLYMQLALGQELNPGATRSSVVSSFTLPAARAAVFSRQVFDRIGGFEENLQVGEDGEFSTRLSRAGIPVNMFFWKTIDHFEEGGIRDYLRQRLRYGRSFVRAFADGRARPACELFARFGPLGIAGCVGSKLWDWVGVASNLHKRVRFVVLWPFLGLFLAFFYWGAYQEFRERRR